MKKKYTVAILGTGGRGYAYGSLIKERPDEFEVVALCDRKAKQLEKENMLFGLPDDAMFLTDTEFFKEKRADILIIATFDRYHTEQCIKAMKLGYDVLLEKPVSNNTEEIYELLKVQKETGCKVAVCHVLRYAPAFVKVSQLLKKGVVGRVVAIDAMERVVYWHQAQAYVRLQSVHNDETFETILAKCCHDLDYIQHYAGSKCKSVSSLGGFDFFLPKNAPKGATKRCLDCPHKETCLFSAKKVYIDRWHELGEPEFIWPFNKVTLDYPTTEENLYKGLETSEFGVCVYHSGVESNPGVVDHQQVQMNFENGVDATLKMQFCAEPGRRVNIFGTHGEIVLDELYDTLEIKPFGKAKQVIKISDITSKDAGFVHGGGDAGLINDLYAIVSGEKTDYTSLEESVESHLIGIKAEESRLSGGILKHIR